MPIESLKTNIFPVSVFFPSMKKKMYKALEAGYQMGLESLNENLSEVRAELVFAQRQLQFKPPLEELRAAYYRETKKFVSIPNTFEGFGNGKVRVEKRRNPPPPPRSFLCRVLWSLSLGLVLRRTPSSTRCLSMMCICFWSKLEVRLFPFDVWQKQVYLRMAAANSKSLLRVYEKAEGIFQRLAALVVS